MSRSLRTKRGRSARWPARWRRRTSVDPLSLWVRPDCWRRRPAGPRIGGVQREKSDSFPVPYFDRGFGDFNRGFGGRFNLGFVLANAAHHDAGEDFDHLGVVRAHGFETE